MVRKQKSVFEKVEAEVVGAAGSYIKEKVTKKILKFGEFSILVLLAFIMISFGIASLLGVYFPELNNGLNFVLLGMLYLVVGFMIRY